MYCNVVNSYGKMCIPASVTHLPQWEGLPHSNKSDIICLSMYWRTNNNHTQQEKKQDQNRKYVRKMPENEQFHWIFWHDEMAAVIKNPTAFVSGANNGDETSPLKGFNLFVSWCWFFSCASCMVVLLLLFFFLSVSSYTTIEIYMRSGHWMNSLKCTQNRFIVTCRHCFPVIACTCMQFSILWQSFMMAWCLDGFLMRKIYTNKIIKRVHAFEIFYTHTA